VRLGKFSRTRSIAARRGEDTAPYQPQWNYGITLSIFPLPRSGRQILIHRTQAWKALSVPRQPCSASTTDGLV